MNKAQHMNTLSTKSLLAVIRAAIHCPNVHGVGIPVLIEGKPGIAKTALIEALASSSGLEPVTVLASIREPEDMLGLPVPSADGSMSRIPDAWAVRANAAAVNGDGSLVFFDEINHGSPRVLASLLRVINERAVGDLQLNRRVRIIAAQNGIGEGGGGELPAPLANRFAHLRWNVPPVHEYSRWLIEGGVPFESESAVEIERRVTERFPDAHAIARGRVAAFLNANEKFFYDCPNPEDPRASGAWPSMRTWDMATRALGISDVFKLTPEEREAFLAACVGEAASVAFAQWEARVDLPDIPALLDGKVEWKARPARPDVSDAVLGACVSLLANGSAQTEEQRRARTLRWVELVKDSMDAGGLDVAYVHVQTATQRGLTSVRGVIEKMVPIYSALSAVGKFIQSKN